MPDLKVLDYTTGTGTSSEFGTNRDRFEITVFCGPEANQVGSNSLGVGETIKFQIQSTDGYWFDLYEGGAVKQLDEDTNVEAIYGPGIFRVVKSATAAAIGVFISMKEQ